jgi:hypothetical protein
MHGRYTRSTFKVNIHGQHARAVVQEECFLRGLFLGEFREENFTTTFARLRQYNRGYRGWSNERLKAGRARPAPGCRSAVPPGRGDAARPSHASEQYFEQLRAANAKIWKSENARKRGNAMKGMQHHRRQFLQTAAVGTAAFGCGELGFLRGLQPVSAQEAQLDPNIVRFDSDIEPLVRLLEDTPRGQVVEAFADRIRRGASYQEVLAALLLAGVRNVQPRPAVGFKFHAVLVVNSAHLASLASADSDRWLPIFWSLDYFKSAQAADVREGDWTMGPVDESAVPAPHQAHAAFREAMERWDEPAADAAVAGLARSAGANELFELFSYYGARDYRSIGHKAIYVANAFRTLHCIGWRYAEPVLRSLAYALLNHTGDPNPAENDLLADRAWRLNQELAPTIKAEWRSGSLDPQAPAEILKVVREGSPEDASRLVADMLNRGVHPQSIYDGLFLGSGELLMRQPAIVALHAVTTSNALHYAFQTTKSDETRRLLLLQNAAFLPHFRESMEGRGNVGNQKIDELEATPVDGAEGPEEAVEAIFDTLNRQPQQAVSHLLNHLKSGGSAEEVMHAARRLIFMKGNDSHDYKFSSAVLEDYHAVTPEWRNHFLASSLLKMRGSRDSDNQLIQRTREALA